MDTETDLPVGEQVADESAQEQQPQQVTPESEAQSETTEKKSPVDPVQKRINQLTWKVHEAERRANAAALAQQETMQRASQAEQQLREIHRRLSMPTPEQFNLDPRQYQAAVEAHYQQTLNQRQAELEQQARQQQAAVAQQQVEQAVNARIVEASQRFPDYQEVVSNPSLPPLPQVNPQLFAALMQHPQMPELTYYLGKNPAEAHRIAALPPGHALVELGRVASTLPKQSSNAPAPPRTVGGNTRADAGPSDNDSVNDWLRKRNAQIRRAQGH